MKKFAVAALMFAAAGAVFADDITPDTYASTPSVASRAQVQAERAQAVRDGSIRAWATTYNPALLAKSTKTRAQVIAELKEAQADGEYAALNDDVTTASVLPTDHVQSVNASGTSAALR